MGGCYSVIAASKMLQMQRRRAAAAILPVASSDEFGAGEAPCSGCGTGWARSWGAASSASPGAARTRPPGRPWRARRSGGSACAGAPTPRTRREVEAGGRAPGHGALRGRRALRPQPLHGARRRQDRPAPSPRCIHNPNARSLISICLFLILLENCKSSDAE